MNQQMNPEEILQTNQLRFPYQPRPSLGDATILWIAKFYDPRHTGDMDRVKRLQEQTSLVLRMASTTRFQLSSAKTGCLRFEIVENQLNIHFREMVTCYKQLKERIQEYRDIQDKWFESGSDSSGDEEQQYRNFRMEHTIGKTFLKKRFLLNFLFFIFENEEEIQEAHKTDLKKLEDLVEDDTTEWMELLDYLRTMRNPNYLKEFENK